MARTKREQATTGWASPWLPPLGPPVVARRLGSRHYARMSEGIQPLSDEAVSFARVGLLLLSAGQVDVLRLTLQGMAIPQIAEVLGEPARTVKGRWGIILRKIGVPADQVATVCKLLEDDERVTAHFAAFDARRQNGLSPRLRQSRRTTPAGIAHGKETRRRWDGASK